MIQRLESILPDLDDENSINPGLRINALGYITALAGYLFAILNTQSLTLPAFLSFTAANIVWFACFIALTRFSDGCSLMQIHALLLGMGLATLWATAMIFAGVSLDWLLPIVTIVVFILVYSLRAALIAGGAIALGVLLLVVFASQGQTRGKSPRI